MNSGSRWQTRAASAPWKMKWLLLPIWVLSWPTCAQDDRCRGPCGRRPRAPGHGGLIHTEGGASLLPGTWPWLVSIQLPEGEGFRHWCGGTLISSRWVLTAAHCFVLKRYIKVEYWRLLVGVTQLSQPGPDAQVLSIKRLVEHENYNRIGYLNDIALIELGRPVDCNNYVQPACLPDDSLAIPTLSHCHFSGWDTADTKKNLKKPDILQEVKVSLLGTEACNGSRWYYTRVKENNLCAVAEKGGKESCQGDGGSPLMCREERSERFWVVGVHSWGSGCTKARMPAVFISTQHFSSWIQRITQETPQPGGQTQPSTLQLQNGSPSWARPTSVPRPTGWFRPRPSLSWVRPNYVPMPPPKSKLPTWRPTASMNGWNQGQSRPQFRPGSQPQKWLQRPQSQPAPQALYSWTQGLPRPPLKPQPQPQMVSQQFQNWTMGWPNTIYRKPRPRPQPAFQEQNQGWARNRL